MIPIAIMKPTLSLFPARPGSGITEAFSHGHGKGDAKQDY
jgi:hypothetical protein